MQIMNPSCWKRLFPGRHDDRFGQQVLLENLLNAVQVKLGGEVGHEVGLRDLRERRPPRAVTTNRSPQVMP